jgi:Pentapeptide repeats (8 copies)
MEKQRSPGQEQRRPPGERAAARVGGFIKSLVADWRPPSQQQILRWTRSALAVGFVVFVVLLLLYVIGRLFGMGLLDLLKILAVPITIGAAVPLLNWLQKERELKVEQQRAQDEALQAYLDQMSQLITDKEQPLHRAPPSDSLRTVARARTLTVLELLDASRKPNVVRFLAESILIQNVKGLPIISLRRASLRGADLIGANLRGADLVEADLEDTDLIGADLRSADLRMADLVRANMIRADLRSAKMGSADLAGADLSRAKLSQADLSQADLSQADLRDADLSGADLGGAYLNDANLRRAIVTQEQLERAKSLEGTVLPNGSTHE